ncbi:MAG: DEAD/DEAH box helicase [Candidatus Thorarchaeota archaeon]
MVKTLVGDLPLNRRVVDVLRNLGINELYPPQELAFRSGVLERRNLVLSAPTSSGKTLVAEICAVHSILERGGKALYLVPLKSLAREKLSEFAKYECLGFSTVVSVSDYESSRPELADADILILTNERADSLIRQRPDWLNDVSVMIADEIHLVGDKTRGPTLEMVIACMKRLCQGLQIIALSATIPNVDQIGRWLDAVVVSSNWRPVPLREGVLLDNEIHYSDSSIRVLTDTGRTGIESLIQTVLNDGGQVLVFVSSRRSAVSLSRRLAPLAASHLSDDERHQLSLYSRRISVDASSPVSSSVLREMIERGLAFHHAGLSDRERATVEDCFRKRLLKIIVATPTLAAGVNLPARCVIVRDYRRFEDGLGNRPIPVLEYKQMAGRAGRPLYDTCGEGILIAQTPEELDFLHDNYVLANAEPTVSRLRSTRALRFHLLAAIAGGLSRNLEEIHDLLGYTLYSVQFPRPRIETRLSLALEFLERKGFVKHESGQILPTSFGLRTSRLYIDPLTAVLFRSRLPDSDDIPVIGLLHLLCHTPDQPLAYVSQSEIDEYSNLLESYIDDLILSPPSEGPRYYRFLCELKTACILHDWISEKSEREITDHYNIGMGDVHRYVESTQWLLYSAGEIARVLGIQKPVKLLQEIRQRVKYGVNADLLELVSLRGVGRVRGRMLYQHGLKRLQDLCMAPVSQIARVPTIGQSLAESIKQQLSGVDNHVGSPPLDDATFDSDYTGQTVLDDFD